MGWSSLRVCRSWALKSQTRIISTAPAPATAPQTSVEPALLKQLGEQTLEVLSEHFRGLKALPVKPKLDPGIIAKRFATSPPAGPTSYTELLKKLQVDVLPGVTHWQHPNFMAYYPASSSVPAILSETVIAAIGSVGLQWSANPIATELEVVVMDWVAQLLGLTGDFLHASGHGGGILQNTAGEAIVAVFVAARVWKHRQLLAALSREEAFYQDSSKLVVYMSDQTHFSSSKACRVAGMRPRTVQAKLVDGNFRLRVADLRQAIVADRANGLIPCVLQLNYGSTNTCGLDDVAEFEELAKEEELWIHVDAAYAGPSWALDEFRADAAAVSRVATSVNVNGSKWFLCGFDSAFLWIRDRRLLTEVYSASDSYMDTDKGMAGIYAPELKDWSVPLGRRFRALRIWLVFEYFGTDVLKQFLRDAIDQASWLRAQVDKHPAFEQPVRTRHGLVCIGLAEATGKAKVTIAGLAEHIQAAGFLSYPSSMQGRPVLRVALGGSSTTLEDVQALWHEMRYFVESPEAAGISRQR